MRCTHGHLNSLQGSPLLRDSSRASSSRSASHSTAAAAKCTSPVTPLAMMGSLTVSWPALVFRLLGLPRLLRVSVVLQRYDLFSKADVRRICCVSPAPLAARTRHWRRAKQS